MLVVVSVVCVLVRVNKFCFERKKHEKILVHDENHLLHKFLSLAMGLLHLAATTFKTNMARMYISAPG